MAKKTQASKKRVRKTTKTLTADCNVMIGQWLKKERERAELSQTQLAKKIGMQSIFVDEYEAGKIGVEVGTFMVIAKILRADALDGIELLFRKSVI